MATSAERDTRTSHEVEVDIHHDLALDVEVHVVNEAVDGGADRPLDGVLNRDESLVDLPVRHRLEHGGDRTERDELGPGQVRLGQQGLLREGGRGPEVGDRGRRGVHSWAG